MKYSSGRIHYAKLYAKQIFVPGNEGERGKVVTSGNPMNLLWDPACARAHLQNEHTQKWRSKNSRLSKLPEILFVRQQGESETAQKAGSEITKPSKVFKTWPRET